MLYVVLVQNEYGMRDAWYVNGNNMLEAIRNASDIMEREKVGASRAFTVVSSMSNRTVPYMFRKDPKTDAEFVLDYLNGHIHTVKLDYHLICELERVSAEAKQETEQTDNGIFTAPLLARMSRYLDKE